MSTIGVVGVPINKGQRKSGVKDGARVLREANLLKVLEGTGLRVQDFGDVDLASCHDFDIDQPEDVNLRHPTYIAEASLKVADKVEECLRTSGACVAVGGDHSMAIGTILGHARVQPEVAVLWIDAHADINTPLTSESGNIHGMPLSFLVKELASDVPPLEGWEDIKPCISARQLAYIGLRDVDDGERAILKTLGVAAFSIHDVDAYGIATVVQAALKAIDPYGDRPLHVSFDIDGMDPLTTPSTGTPVPGGLTVRELSYIGEEVARTGRLTMLDVAEFNPHLGSDQDQHVTTQNTLTVISRFFKPTCGCQDTQKSSPLLKPKLLV